MTEFDIINDLAPRFDGATWCIISGTAFYGHPSHWNWNVTRRTLDYALQGYVVKTRRLLGSDTPTPA
jgi:hypothetical protein